MADTDPQTIRAINWREVFPFTNLFRAFRIAVHPSKLILALAALLVLYIGGRIMDGVWPARHSAVYREMDEYTRPTADESRRDFADTVQQARERNQRQYAGILQASGVVTNPDQALKDAERFDHVGEVKRRINAARAQVEVDANRRYEEQRKTADALTDAAAKERAHREARDKRDRDVAAAMASAHAEWERLDQMLPQGIFETFFGYQVSQVNSIAKGILAFEWRAVYAGVENFFFTGPVWLLRFHPVYFVLFMALFLVVWAVFGGAIARIAAVHVARDEKISVRQAMKFSTNKVLSFIFAPLIPLAIVLVIGVVLSLGGLLFYVPVIGPILAGALFILALLGGVVITLVLLGTFGGFNLMYPTIAVEGSDSFDAISRSFSYVFARPWRMLFYTLIALIYGAIAYFFVRLFVWIVLATTRFFVGWWLGGQPGRWFPEMWPQSMDLWNLPYDVHFASLAWSEKVAAFFIACWVYLLVSLVGAFAISFYFSVNTIIYYLMRREVDATELDDVYVEE
ncbi:MAG TPA: hypothetical protein VNB23_14580 [Ramlibacter sp.]|nr:hypothetical protein [Ramlibacter sp.]